MSTPYHIFLVNLSADARAVATETRKELRDAGDDALQALLRNFCAIDPIENALGDTEIRVHVRHEKYLLRTEQGKLILYDVNQRDLPAQILTVAEAMHELGGTAGAARNQAILLARAEAGPVVAPGPVLPVMAPAATARRPLVLALAVTAGLLFAAILWLAAPFAAESAPAGFLPLEPAEVDKLQGTLTGVYLTGSEPGQHGIVVTGPGELKLFELGSVEAPRLVYASYRPGRIGGKTCLVTDQPGGVIEIAADGNLVYCGETYERIP